MSHMLNNFARSYTYLVISNLATLLQNWRRKNAVGDFFGASFLEARAAPVTVLLTYRLYRESDHIKGSWLAMFKLLDAIG